MSKLISQVALLLFTSLAVEIGCLAVASAADPNDSIFFRDGTLNCTGSVCEFQRISSNIATAPSPQTIPEPSTVGAILATGLGIFLSRRKGKFSQPE